MKKLLATAALVATATVANAGLYGNAWVDIRHEQDGWHHQYVVNNYSNDNVVGFDEIIKSPRVEGEVYKKWYRIVKDPHNVDIPNQTFELTVIVADIVCEDSYWQSYWNKPSDYKCLRDSIERTRQFDLRVEIPGKADASRMKAEVYGYVPYTVNQRISKTVKNFVENNYRIFENYGARSLSDWSLALEAVAPHLDPNEIIHSFKAATQSTGRIDMDDFLPWFDAHYPDLLEKRSGGVKGSYWADPNNYNKPLGFMQLNGTTVAGFGND